MGSENVPTAPVLVVLLILGVASIALTIVGLLVQKVMELKRKPLEVVIDRKLHNRLGKFCTSQNINITDACEEALKKWLDEADGTLYLNSSKTGTKE